MKKLHLVPLFALLVSFVISCCDRGPETYPPPAQYAMPGGSPLPVLALGVPNPDAWVLGDIHEDTPLVGVRWTGAHPRFAFRLNRTENLDLVIRMEVHEIPFSHTGPVTVSIRINGQLISQRRYDSPGIRDYREPVPPAVLRSQSPAIVSMDIDPAWVADDQAVFGVLLTYIGFQEHAG